MTVVSSEMPSAVGPGDETAHQARSVPSTASSDSLFPGGPTREAAEHSAQGSAEIHAPSIGASPRMSVASASRASVPRIEESSVVNRSRSSSVSAAIKATFHRPSTSSGLPSDGQSPSSSSKSKSNSRLRAGTWKGSNSRSSGQSSRPELPAFDGSDRTPRASVYGSAHDAGLPDSRSSIAVASTSQLHLSPAGGDGTQGATRRKLFGRSNSIRDLGKQASPEPTNPPTNNILRRIGSRGFFGVGSSKDGLRSSENLAASAINEGSAKSWNNDSSKLGPSSAWPRKKSKSKQPSDSDSTYSMSNSITESGSAGLEASPSPTSVPLALKQRESMESSRSMLSVAAASRGSRVSTSGEARTQASLSAAQGGNGSNSGLPKRLSGWLLNMMSNDPAATGITDASQPSRVDSDRASARSASKSPSLGTGSPRATSPTRDTDAASASSAVASHASASSRSKAGSLLYSFSAGPNKVSRSGSANGPPVGAGSGGWSAGGSGFDRALKYFLDSDTDAEEGIWLLGVWHGPSRAIPSDDQAQIEDPSLTDPQGSSDSGGMASSQITTHGGGDRDAGVVADAHAQGDGGEALTQTPASVNASLPTSSPRLGSEDGFVLARNPPTPHTSPVKVRSIKGRSQPSSAANTIRSTSTEQSESCSSPATSAQHYVSRIATDVDWQASFQADFSSRIWCTYRNNFGPIARDGTISEQAASAAAVAAEAEANAALSGAAAAGDRAGQPAAGGARSWLGRKLTESSVGRDGLTPATIASALGGGGNGGLATSPSSLGDKMGITGLWGRATAAAQAAGFSRAGLTTDAGWGCMLRTGQSLLANALIDTHLGRDWTRTPAPLAQSKLADQQQAHSINANTLQQYRRQRKVYATYVKLLSWFLDDPSPACPFGVHRMAREGKRLGKEVGEWFGPSTAAGAIQALVDEFPEAGLGVALAHDGSVYLDEVRAAALNRTVSSRRRNSQAWQRPVLILIGIRLGLEGVNPMYYDSVKATFSFPQSVGISGGRPSSSYYFMGHQGNSLFYLDPHHVRPAVPLRYPPTQYPPATPSSSDDCTPEDNEDEWWSHAYTEPQLATFHCDKVRRMPIKSLDPSMLLGFLCKDEADLQDLCSRVKAMSKTIFAFSDTAPRWADDDEFDPSMESFSESSVGDAEDDRDADDDDDDFDEDERGGDARGPIAFPSGPAVPEDPASMSSSTVADIAPAPAGLGSQRAPGVAQRHERKSGAGLLAFPSLERPALSTSDRSNTMRPKSESRHVSGSSEATTRAHSRTRTGTGARRISNNMLAARTTRRAPSPVTGDESFSTVSFSDSEVGSAWEELSEGGTVAGSHHDVSAGVSTEGSADASPPRAEKEDHAGESAPRSSSDLVDVALDTPVEERNRPVLVTSSPSGYAVNGAPLSASSLASASGADQPSDTQTTWSAHAALQELPRRKSRLDWSPPLS